MSPVETMAVYQNTLWCMGTSPSFYAMFSKGDNFRGFLFAYLEDKVFSKWGLLLKKRICSLGANPFFKSRPHLGANS